MTYNKTTWKSQDIITKEKLNNLESGVEAATNAVEQISTDNFATKEELSGYAKTDELDATYATDADVALKVDKTELSNLVTKDELEGYAKREELDEFLTDADIVGKADKTELNNYIVKDIKNAGNDSYINNETTGPIMKFVKEDGSFGKITLTDATDSNKIYAQIVASKEDKSEIAKLDISTSGIHYIKEDNNTLSTDNELAVKKDLSGYVSLETYNAKIQELEGRISALEG